MKFFFVKTHIFLSLHSDLKKGSFFSSFNNDFVAQLVEHPEFYREGLGFFFYCF